VDECPLNISEKVTIGLAGISSSMHLLVHAWGSCCCPYLYLCSFVPVGSITLPASSTFPAKLVMEALAVNQPDHSIEEKWELQPSIAETIVIDVRKATAR
jgi:hypothetical protein